MSSIAAKNTHEAMVQPPQAFASLARSPSWSIGASLHRQQELRSTELSALAVPSCIPAATNAVRNVFVGGASAIFSRLPRPNPPVLILLGLFVGFFFGRLTGQRSGAQRVSNVPLEPGANLLEESDGAPSIEDDEGYTPLWLNYALARMWALFQRNTKRLVADVLQPALDQTEYPPFVTDVRVTGFTPGRRSPYFRSLKRLPSRSLSEVQYSINTLLASTLTVEFEVDVAYKDAKLTIPVTLRNLDFDALWWTSLGLTPYEPYLSTVQYSLLQSPRISFDMTVFKLIPITTVPLLRKFFFEVITKEVPKEFMFPNSAFLDFRPPEIIKHSIVSKEETAQERLKDLDPDQLKELFPEQFALFDALDLDGGGTIEQEELLQGLKRWGYTAEDSAASFEKLDVDKDGLVDFVEFIDMWPKLEENFVPNRYKGVVTVFLKRSKDLPLPLFGPTDPVVKLKLGDEVVKSKRDIRTSPGGGKKAESIWNEAFELNCQSPRDQELEIVVEEGMRLGLRRRGAEIARSKVPLSKLLTKKDRKLNIKLEPQGTMRLDLSYADFVDRRS